VDSGQWMVDDSGKYQFQITHYILILRQLY
jgi:hypothetical protein